MDRAALSSLDAAQTREHVRAGGVWLAEQVCTVEVAGADAVRHLDAMGTQSIAEIAVGETRHCLFLTVKAKIIAATLAYRVADDRVLLEVSCAQADALDQHLARYRLTAKCTIEQAQRWRVNAIGSAAPGPDWLSAAPWGIEGYATLVESDALDETLDVVRRQLGKQPADRETLEALRIEQGMPAFSDLLPESMPAEVGAMDYAVSLTKGCYLGQEPVARLHYRGHPNRTLRRVTLSGKPAALPAELSATGRDRPVGQLTSAARSQNTTVGLCILRREIEAGTELTLPDGSTAVVAD